MGTLIDTLEATGAASVIWNEFEIRVTASQWENEATGAEAGAELSGWIVEVTDYLAARDNAGNENRARGMRTQIIHEHRVTAWDDLISVLAELGVPDDFSDWR